MVADATSDTAPNCVLAYGSTYVGGSYPFRAISASIAVTTTPVYLVFKQQYFRSYFSLLVATNGESRFTNVVNAGCSFLAGGYDDPVNNLWTGSLTGEYSTVVLAVASNLVGTTLSFKWEGYGNSSFSP